MRYSGRGLRTAATGLVLVCIGVGELHADEADLYRGRPLVEVLEELQEAGLALIFSSAVVGDDVVVSVEPATAEPREILEQILEPLGLESRDGPGGSILVLPRKRPTSDEPERPVFSTEVVVIPGRHSVLREEQVATRSVYQEDAVLVPSLAGDASRVVEQLPGVTAADNSAAFHVRGSLTEDSSFVLDGLELYDPFHLQSFQSPFSLIDSKLVDQIEFLGGGLTADYGDRHGAFVEISTLSPGNRAGGEVELGTLNSRVTYQTPVAQGAGAVLFSLRGWYPEALFDAVELGGGGKQRPRFGDAYVKLSWMLSPRTLISAHGLLAYDRLDYVERTDEVNETVDATTNSNYFWVRALHSWSDRLTSEAVLSGGGLASSRAGVSVPEEGVFVVDDDREVSFLGLTYDLGWQVSPSHLIKAGALARRLGAEYRYSKADSEDPDSAEPLELEPDGNSVGLYAAYRTLVSPSLSTELGLRWDRQDYTDDNQLSPRFNLVWRADESTDLRFAVGRFHQSQRIHELRVEDGETEFLPAEVAQQIELTFQHRFGRTLRLRFDAYTRKLSNLRPRYENLFRPVELFPETSDDRVTVAPDSARLRGAELMLSDVAGGPFTWWVSYVYSSAEDKIDGEYVPRSWDQPHAGKFLVGYQWRDRWFVSLAGTAHTGWPTTPVSGTVTMLPDGSFEVEPIPGERNSIRFPNYRRLDLKARRSFALEKSRLSLTLAVFNVTNRKNACCLDDISVEPQDDGSFKIGTLYDYWLGFVPSFSLLWQF